MTEDYDGVLLEPQTENQNPTLSTFIQTGGEFGELDTVGVNNKKIKYRGRERESRNSNKQFEEEFEYTLIQGDNA